MSFTEAQVAKGRLLVLKEGESKFALGDLALEVDAMRDGPGRPEIDTRVSITDKTLEAFAEEIGMEFQTLRAYRAVASAWPRDERAPDAPWTVHRELASLAREDEHEAARGIMRQAAERHKDGAITYRGVRLALDKPIADDYSTAPHHAAGLDETEPGSTPESKRETLKGLLADPEVGPAAMKDPQTRQAARKAIHEGFESEHDEQRKAREPSEAPQTPEDYEFDREFEDASRRAHIASAVADAASEISHATAKLRQVSSILSDRIDERLDERYQGIILTALGELHTWEQNLKDMVLSDRIAGEAESFLQGR